MKTPKLFQALFGHGKTTTARLHIEGMSCAGCVAKIEKAIGDLPGISSVRIDLDTGQATIAYQPNEVTDEQIREQVAAAGHVATAVTEG